MAGWPTTQETTAVGRKGYSFLGFVVLASLLALVGWGFRTYSGGSGDGPVPAGAVSKNGSEKGGGGVKSVALSGKAVGKEFGGKASGGAPDFLSVGELSNPGRNRLFEARGVVRWTCPEAPALNLLETGHLQAAEKWLATRSAQLGGAENQQEYWSCRVLAARVSAGYRGKAAYTQFKEIAAKCRIPAVRADALFGAALCKAGRATRIPGKTLTEIRRLAPGSWGAARAALEAARRLERSPVPRLATLEAARALYQEALLSDRLLLPVEKACEKRLNYLTDKIVLAPGVKCAAPKAVIHTVRPGENQTLIARRYKTAIGQPARLNNLRAGSVLRPGRRLKILPGPVKVVIDCARLHATLFIDGVFIRRRPVCIGPGAKTPRGRFRIANRKSINPTWYYHGKIIPFGDPRNILGTRWIPFDDYSENGTGAGIGIHGTTKPKSVPGRFSAGCIRMHNADVEEFYDFIPPGAVVVVRD